jgi:hypothetical protein
MSTNLMQFFRINDHVLLPNNTLDYVIGFSADRTRIMLRDHQGWYRYPHKLTRLKLTRKTSLDDFLVSWGRSIREYNANSTTTVTTSDVSTAQS